MSSLYDYSCILQIGDVHFLLRPQFVPNLYFIQMYMNLLCLSLCLFVTLICHLHILLLLLCLFHLFLFEYLLNLGLLSCHILCLLQLLL